MESKKINVHYIYRQMTTQKFRLVIFGAGLDVNPIVRVTATNQLIEMYKRNHNYAFVASSLQPPILIDIDFFPK
ncbi:hypothetical protein SRABI96_00842 [Peribacillus sp. Bi96]|nr:hypothetical protein SRABI96_00842 [Peribacillus sp. Bi96]